MSTYKFIVSLKYDLVAIFGLSVHSSLDLVKHTSSEFHMLVLCDLFGSKHNFLVFALRVYY